MKPRSISKASQWVRDAYAHMLRLGDDTKKDHFIKQQQDKLTTLLQKTFVDMTHEEKQSINEELFGKLYYLTSSTFTLSDLQTDICKQIQRIFWQNIDREYVYDEIPHVKHTAKLIPSTFVPETEMQPIQPPIVYPKKPPFVEKKVPAHVPKPPLSPEQIMTIFTSFPKPPIRKKIIVSEDIRTLREGYTTWYKLYSSWHATLPLKDIPADIQQAKDVFAAHLNAPRKNIHSIKNYETHAEQPNRLYKKLHILWTFFCETTQKTEDTGS